MSNGEHADFVELGHESVQRHVSGAPEGDHELAKIVRQRSPDQRVLLEQGHGRPDRARGTRGGGGIVLGNEREESLEIVERLP